MASSTVAVRPIASKTKSGPPSVRSRSAAIVAAGSSVARMPSVAPTSRATSSLAATRSIATIRAAPARTAPMTHDRPDAAEADDRDLAPAGTSAVLRTAPTPVETQQPMSAATAGSTPSGSGMAAASGTTVVVGHRADPAVRQDRLAGSVVSAVAPSGRRCRNEGESGHAHGRPARHQRQTPHGTSHDSATG